MKNTNTYTNSKQKQPQEIQVKTDHSHSIKRQRDSWNLQEKSETWTRRETQKPSLIRSLEGQTTAVAPEVKAVAQSSVTFKISLQQRGNTKTFQMNQNGQNSFPVSLPNKKCSQEEF